MHDKAGDNHKRTKTSAPTPLDRILESVVVINWSNLVRGTISAVVHVEYHIDEDRFSDNVRIWSSTARGYWSLVIARDPNCPG